MPTQVQQTTQQWSEWASQAGSGRGRALPAVQWDRDTVSGEGLCQWHQMEQVDQSCT